LAQLEALVDSCLAILAVMAALVALVALPE
jgi:hypothetical protein